MTDTGRPDSEGSVAPKTQRVKIIGFPGESQGILTVPHYIGDKAHLNSHGPNGAPGFYTVGFVLAKPSARNSPENEIKFMHALRGDSHLALTKPAVAIAADLDQLQISYTTSLGTLLFRGYPNDAGYLAKITSDPFVANDRHAAQRAATTAMQGLLSNLSAQLDIPLHVEFVEVTETATQSREILFEAPFAPVSMSVRAHGKFEDPEFEHAVALYREALNSNTPIYRFLCFYKILELSRKRRERLGRRHKSTLKQPRLGEEVPLQDKEAMEKWLNALFYANRNWDEGIFKQVFIPEALGKKINNIFDKQLRPIRDRIAHGILDSGEFLLLDKAEDRDKVIRWLPILRCLARRIMKNDFEEYLEYLHEDGSIIKHIGE